LISGFLEYSEGAKALSPVNITYSFVSVKMKNLVIIVIALLVGYLVRKIYEKWRDRNAKR